FSSRRRHTRSKRDWSSDVCSSDLSDLAIQTMKDPYLFDFISLKGKVKEIEIERAMIDRIKDVLIELGKGFAFVGEQYKITVSERSEERRVGKECKSQWWRDE